MKLICLFLLLISVSCSVPHSERFREIPKEGNTEALQTEMFLSDEKSLNVYYDMALLDTCLVFADYYSDSLIQIRSLGNPDSCIFSLYKGNGPHEYMTPYFDKSVKEGEVKALMFSDLNMRKFVRIKSDNGGWEIDEDFMPADFPFAQSLNETSRYIYGVDAEAGNNRLFFIWDKKEKRIVKSVDYYPDVTGEYRKESWESLYACNICVNEEAGMVAVAMQNMNLIHFYDLEGNVQVSYQIGKAVLYPEADHHLIDFSHSDKYFMNICGDERYVYCLYNGKKLQDGASEIWVFDWSGHLVKRCKSDKSFMGIIADHSGNRLFGISLNAEGGTDILKIAL